MAAKSYLSYSFEKFKENIEVTEDQMREDDDVGDQIMDPIIKWLNNSKVPDETMRYYVDILFECDRLKRCSTEKLTELSARENVSSDVKIKIDKHLQHAPHGCSMEAKAPRSYVIAEGEKEVVIPMEGETEEGAVGAIQGATAAAAASAQSSEEHVVLAGGFTTDLTKHGNISFLCKPRDRASILTSIPPQNDNAEWLSVCASPDGFIVSAAPNEITAKSVSRVQKYSLADHKWTDLPDMLHPSSAHGSICVNNRFITAGGVFKQSRTDKLTLASVTILNLHTLEWSVSEQPLDIAVIFSGVTAVGTDVLVVGGANDLGEPTINTYRYDTLNGRRAVCQSMPQPCIPSNRTVTMGDFVFVLHGDGRLFMQYNHRLNQWNDITLPCPVAPSRFCSMVLHKGRLVMTGGFEDDDPSKPSNRVQSFDIDNKTWTLEKHTMPLPLVDHTAIVVTLPSM